MSLDTLLLILIGGLAAAMTVLGGHLASNKPIHRWAFYLMGVLSVGLIAWQGIRSQSAVEQLTSTLSRLEKNTQQAPKVEVNMPPGPKQRAIMALSRNKADDGIEIFRDSQYLQFGWLVNVSCRNVGTVIAKRVACPEYTERIPATRGIPAKQTLQQAWNDFSKQLAASHLPQSVDLEPGRNAWGTVSLNMGDVDPELNSGSKVVFVAGAILYSDDAGSHKKEFCEWAQAPFNPKETTWHFCEIGHNREVY